jgi:putative peptide zinc metalloprotease protein
VAADKRRIERVLSPLRVGLRTDLHVTRQITRSGPRYLVHDPVNFHNHAFTPTDYRVMTAIVRRRTLGETFRALLAEGLLQDGEEQREAFYRFVMWLHGIGLVRLPITGGSVAFDRMQQKKKEARGPWYRLLMSHRVPLWNPDAFLDRTLRWTGWLFSPAGALLWTALMAIVAWKCVGRFDELFAESTNLLALANLPILWIALVALKALHEFGHAYACKRFGAPVPEMGVQVMMLTPCAYVDAGASWRLPRARQRVVVALGGMYVESFVAGVAALVWAGTGDGLWHVIALNVVALASVVTVLFNLNPLMKFDGYYLFSDLVGVFNLQRRAQAYLVGWANRIALGKPRPADHYAPSERLLYAVYGPASFVYRLLLAFGMTALMMTQWPGAGLFLGVTFAWALMVRPTAALLSYLWSHESTAPQRTRARLVALALVTLTPLAGGLLPISASVTSVAVLDPQVRQSVRAPVGGFVETVDVDNGAEVAMGTRLCVLANPELALRRLRLAGELLAEEEGFDAIELDDPTQAAIHRARISYLRASVQEIDRRIASMTVTASAPGTVAIDGDGALEGRFLPQGRELFQIQSDHRHLRVVLSEEDVARARLEIGSVAEVRWSCDPTRTTRGVVREVRSSASRLGLPLPLTMLGGGEVYVRPIGDSLTTAEAAYLHVVVEVDEVPLDSRGAGLTAKVRFHARLQLLGGWLRNRVLSFWSVWKMS